jgi:nicotinamidase-related amidase
VEICENHSEKFLTDFHGFRAQISTDLEYALSLPTQTFNFMKKIIIVLISLIMLPVSIIFAQDKKPERMHPALLVIDIQNQFLPMMDKQDTAFAMYAINAYIGMFRANGFPVIRIYHSDKDYGPFPGTPEFEFPQSVNILAEDPKIIKTYGNGFNKTDLGKILRDKGVNTLFLCGLSSVGCVLATYMGANDQDFKAFLIKDATMSHNADYTKSIEEIFGALSYDAISVMLENAEK